MLHIDGKRLDCPIMPASYGSLLLNIGQKQENSEIKEKEQEQLENIVYNNANRSNNTINDNIENIPYIGDIDDNNIIILNETNSNATINESCY